MKKLIIPAVFCVSLFMCASAPTTEGHYDVLQYKNEGNIYDRYLVAVESYTTNGAVYQKKHIGYLYGVAKIIVTEKKLAVMDRSIGFYYDKKENRKDKLFLGVDVKVNDADVLVAESYEKNGRVMVGKYLKEIMAILHSCTGILDEGEVKGIVIGLIWERGGSKELINVWMPKADIEMFYKNTLTLNELVIRSTVTNTDGRIIRLAL